ncbi:MAG: 3-methyl-2-oxobutanoate hydroxymethyltransferase [Bdellovibrionales bacterium]
MNVAKIRQAKSENQKLTMVTCYDYTSARLLEDSAVDLILVGDSAAMVMHGYNDTLPATLEMMEFHVNAVRRGAPKKFIVADLPFLTFRSSIEENTRAVRRLMQAGANAVKLEGYDGNGDWIRHLTEAGVPVMGHTGLTPQFVNQFGGFKVQGRGAEEGRKILSDAQGLQEAGCFSIVLECIPSPLANEITASLTVPTIGIGAGGGCDGQVLVWQDLLGLSSDFKPKFVRSYLPGRELIQKSLSEFCADVKGGRFPSNEESYQ